MANEVSISNQIQEINEMNKKIKNEKKSYNNLKSEKERISPIKVTYGYDPVDLINDDFNNNNQLTSRTNENEIATHRTTSSLEIFPTN